MARSTRRWDPGLRPEVQSLVMKNKPGSTGPQNKVVSLDRTQAPNPAKPRVVARDTVSRRIIIGIGGERFALDFTSRFTPLAPGTGDAPAPVLPWKKERKSKRDQDGRQPPQRGE